MTNTVIRCDQISVQYTSPTHASMSLKESAIRLLKGHDERPRFFNALGDVSLSIGRGETVAFIGPNGCGKSTLLKVIAGVITPQKGTVNTCGIIAPLIELGAGFDAELTGVENIWMSCRLMGASSELIREKLPEIIAFAELGDFIHAPVKTYSSGMYMRLGFACSTIINPEILLVDEILAVGDSRFQRKCIDRIHQIQAENKTIAIVSHDQATIEGICSRAIFLWRGKVIYDGSPKTAFQIYERLMSDAHLHDKPEEVAEEVLRVNKLAPPSQLSPAVRVIEGLRISGGLLEVNGKRHVEVVCDLKVLKPCDPPITIGFQIRHRTQGRVYGTNTKIMPNLTHTQRADLGQPGALRVKWVYDCTMLSSGIYDVDVCVSDYEITQVHDLVGGAFEFHITHPIDLENHDKNLIELKNTDFSITSV